MNDAVSRKAILEWIDRNHVGGKISAEVLVTRIQAGEFSIPSSAKGLEGTQGIELTLLKMWADAGIKEVYKYKYRIKAYRVPFVYFDLLYDPSSRMFTDVEDIANTRDSCPEDGKVSITEMIRKREALSPNGVRKETPREALEQAIRDFPGDMTSGTSAQALINWLESTTSFVYDKEESPDAQ